MSKRKDALIRGGHKYPEQILADLEAGGCIVLDPDEAAEYELVMEQIEDTRIKGLTLEEYIKHQCDKAHDAGFKRGLDLANARYS